MTYFYKGLIIFALSLLGVIFFFPGRMMAQEAQPQECTFITVTGMVTAIDWVGSVLVVNTGGDDLSLVVSRETVIKQGVSEISLGEINQNDAVNVKYFDCGFAGLKAVTVTVTSGY